MVTGYNPYLGPRFIHYYLNPTSVNPNDPTDPNYAIPDGQFNDFYGWLFGITFDSSDNLYVYDTNRGKVLIYYTSIVNASSNSSHFSVSSFSSTNYQNSSYSIGAGGVPSGNGYTQNGQGGVIYQNSGYGNQSSANNSDNSSSSYPVSYTTGSNLISKIAALPRTIYNILIADSFDPVFIVGLIIFLGGLVLVLLIIRKKRKENELASIIAPTI